MNYIAKIFIYIVLVIAVNMVLFNIFHVKDYVAAAISVAIVVLAATYEFRKK
jgi:hypothetical protein